MLSDKQEEDIKELLSRFHKMRLACPTMNLLFITYRELEAEREKSKQLMFLCDICSEKDK